MEGQDLSVHGSLLLAAAVAGRPEYEGGEGGRHRCHRKSQRKYSGFADSDLFGGRVRVALVTRIS